MKISSLINLLQEIEIKEGDLDVYTNGEHGVNESILLESDYVSVGAAHINFETSHLDIDPKSVVCHIGGY